MSTRGVFIVLAVLAGLASGPSALESAASSRPPLRWGDIAAIFAFCFVGLPIVLGIQLTRRPEPLRWVWPFFAFGAVYCFAAGVSAIFISVIRAEFGPHSMLILVIGGGQLLGVSIIKWLFPVQFSNQWPNPSVKGTSRKRAAPYVER
jgi:hypothetical protein